VSVLAGAINTRFVAAINAAGGRSVGLTGADAGVAPVEPMPLLRSAAGDTVSLGLVGRPVHDGEPHLLLHVLGGGYVPVVATIGAGADGTLYNVNADTMAAALAVRLKASRLLIAGRRQACSTRRPDNCRARRRGRAGLDLRRHDQPRHARQAPGLPRGALRRHRRGGHRRRPRRGVPPAVLAGNAARRIDDEVI